LPLVVWALIVFQKRMPKQPNLVIGFRDRPIAKLGQMPKDFETQRFR